ncbi:MAG: protocatechuate 3,4-dioxygenase [Xanthomonadales bacterium]|nr:protocatechuate 3,4-dioxygenase [Xanthomonadales bacterium]NNL94260.1 protocatechuate 3,4-dioxygenase [Xanthomonadales bacterium]
MKQNKLVSRRAVIKASAGAAAGAIAANSVAGSLSPTPANPEGPFYPIHEQTDRDADLTRVAGRDGRAQGEVVRVSGRVLDESGEPIANAVVDIWQANAAGRYDHEGDTSDSPKDPNFQGWAIVKTDADGRYSFTTIKPGAYTAMGDWVRPPHIHYKVSRRGYHELITQMYWDGDPLNDKDELFLSLPEAERERLLVGFETSGEVSEGTFDIVLSAVSAA